MDVIYSVLSDQMDLPFYVSGAGISNPEYHITRKEGLVSHQILISMEGTGMLKIDGKIFRLSEGSIFYIRPGYAHEYMPEIEGQWKTAWVVFRGAYLTELMKKMNFGDYYVGEVSDFKQACALFYQVFNAIKEPFRGAENASKALYDYLLFMRGMISGKKEKEVSYYRIEKALEMIENEYARDITLQELADLSKVSKQHFCRLFKEQMGLRPIEYLAQKRVAKAKALLEQTDLAVWEIAKEVGYGDLNYFGIVFKKYEGISPGKYRLYRHRQ